MESAPVQPRVWTEEELLERELYMEDAARFVVRWLEDRFRKREHERFYAGCEAMLDLGRDEDDYCPHAVMHCRGGSTCHHDEF